MCGIAGYFSNNTNDLLKNALQQSVKKLQHRGPDGKGFYFGDSVGLGHARLAIIDLKTGTQPLYNENQSLVLIVNGEFYNYRQLKKELIKSGHLFQTQSDSEVFIHLYETHTVEKSLNRLNGMWALALWDSQKKRGLLSRDRMGKKPLFYYEKNGQLFFASEIKALLEFPGIPHEIDEKAMALYLKYSYIPAPYTIYKDIYKFPKAGFGIFEDGKLTIKPYWLLPEAIDHTKSNDEWAEKIETTLADAVKIRMISDVPLGGFLSGGLDSSLIAHYMMQFSTHRVKSFCIGFDDPSYDESAYSQTVSNSLNTDHHIYKVSFDQAEEWMNFISHFDEPFSDASFIPTWYLCRETRKQVTVSLSGDGSDELFGGYRRYLARKYSQHYLNLPKFIRRFAVEPVVQYLPAKGGYYGKSIIKKAKLFISAANRIAAAPQTGNLQIFSNEMLKNLFPDLNIPDAATDPLLSDRFTGQGIDPVESLLRSDFHYYLTDDILVKVDRMSMYHSLEVRCPFLDYRLVELAYQMPMSLKIKRLTSKYILRRISRRHLPRQAYQRGKQGFMVPLDIWFRGHLKDLIRDIIVSKDTPWSNKSALNLLNEHLAGKQDNALQLWSLLVLGSFKPKFC